MHREDSGPDDAFVSIVKRSYGWAKENSRVVSIVLTVVIVLGAAILWYRTQQAQLENQAAARFTQVQQGLSAGNLDVTIRDLESYLDRFGGTRTADQARLLLASIMVSQDRAAEGLEALTEVTDDPREPLGLAAARLRAAALEALGRPDEAVDTYRGIARRARFDYQRREALADAARVRLQNGDPDQAALLYQDVIDTFEDDDPQRSYYQMWLAEARAQAERGVTTPTDSPATTPLEPQDTTNPAG